MSRFVDPFTDVGFKIVFGKENQSNEILRSFLNDLFQDQEDFDPIKSLTISTMSEAANASTTAA